ncbi:hypothetical protein P3T76_004123 [Phytophthora citrophthora]|uniref:Uncharacterized protein n=1 Tax=Phytophthora citrophthora TaxID=4793 RepID=A0AAD9LQ16_9STRA|nr:hypothetical protein P3T76_004123 [Phytophthora citrophthora]
MPNKLERRLSDHFKGLKRSIAVGTAVGSGHAMKVGKDPLQYDLYKFICSEMLSDLSLDMVFSRTYMIIAWNLMCRSAKAFGIMMDHMEWRDDALCIYFSPMKMIKLETDLAIRGMYMLTHLNLRSAQYLYLVSTGVFSLLTLLRVNLFRVEVNTTDSARNWTAYLSWITLQRN